MTDLVLTKTAETNTTITLSWTPPAGCVGDVFHADDLNFELKRDMIVQRIRATTWFKQYDEYDELPQLVEELADAEDTDAFDSVWDCIYDIADADRVWIATF